MGAYFPEGAARALIEGSVLEPRNRRDVLDRLPWPSTLSTVAAVICVSNYPFGPSYFALEAQLDRNELNFACYELLHSCDTAVPAEQNEVLANNAGLLRCQTNR